MGEREGHVQQRKRGSRVTEEENTGLYTYTEKEMFINNPNPLSYSRDPGREKACSFREAGLGTKLLCGKPGYH